MVDPGSLNSISSDTILFLSLEGNKYSRTRNFFNGLKTLGQSTFWFEINRKHIIRDLMALKKEYCNKSIVLIVSSPSQILVPFVCFVFRSKPVLDAGWPLIDGVVSSRQEFGFFGSRFIKTYLTDILAFHLCRFVFLESNEQIEYCVRTFLLKRRKVEVLFTGCDESRFEKSNCDAGERNREKTILFRGGNQVEAGLEVIARATSEMSSYFEGVKVLVITNRVDGRLNFGKSVELKLGHLPDLEISKAYQTALIALGQLSKHPRLKRTIPHKFFEAAYFGLPYLSAETPFMNRCRDNGAVQTFSSCSPSQFVEAIHTLVSDEKKRDLLSRNIKKLYEEEFSQRSLSLRLLTRVLPFVHYVP